MRVWVVLIALSGCGRVGYGDSDPTRFGEPVRLAELSSDSRDLDPALTADRLLIYFTSERPGGAGGGDIWFARRSDPDGPWDPPQPVSELNGPDEDITADISADGLTIWFASKRAGVNNVAILVATRDSRDAHFGPPSIAAPAIDTGAGEFSPTLYAGGTRMLYASDSDDHGGGGDIWETRVEGDQFQPRVNRDDLNTDRNDGAPAVFDGGLAVVFGRRDPEPFDLFVATRPDIDAAWGEAVPLDELNTPGRDNGAWVSDDGLVVCFDSDRDHSGDEDLFCSERVQSGL